MIDEVVVIRDIILGPSPLICEGKRNSAPEGALAGRCVKVRHSPHVPQWIIFVQYCDAKQLVNSAWANV